MSRLFIFALVGVIALLSVSLVAAENAPIPAGMELPVINHPINSNRAAREKVRRLSNLVATEPEAVKLFEKEQAAAAAAAEDTWNGEEDPEGNHNLAHQADLKEMKALQKLIVHGKKILRVLPAKIKRLNALKKKAAHFLGVKAKREALEKLEKQESLLKSIRAKESAVAKRLKSLRNSQGKLAGSINRIKRILGNKMGKGKKGKRSQGKPKPAQAKPKPAQAKPKPAQAKPSAPRAFIESETETEGESEADAEAEAQQSVETELLNAEEPQAQALDEFNLADL